MVKGKTFETYFVKIHENLAATIYADGDTAEPQKTDLSRPAVSAEKGIPKKCCIPSLGLAPDIELMNLIGILQVI